MNYKFTLGNVSVNLPGDVKVEVKDIGVEVTDVNLKDIPSIIKETRKVFKDIQNAVNVQHHDFQFEGDKEEERPYTPQEEGFFEFLNGLAQSNAAHHEGCIAEDMANHVAEAIKLANPGAEIIRTPFGLAVAVPKGENKPE